MKHLNSGESPATVACMTGIIIGYETLNALVVEGLLSPQKAAQVMVKSANHMRSWSEVDPMAAPLGERAAQVCEFYAGMIFRRNDQSNEQVVERPA